MARKFRSERAGLTNQLLEAAYGKGTFSATVECPHCGGEVPVPALAPDKRLTAITKALEFSIGRPATQKAPAAAKEEEEAPGLLVE